MQSVISQIAMYPLADFDGKPKRTDWNSLISLPKFLIGGDSKGERKFVQPEKFFDQLGTVLDGVPPLRGEEALVAQFRALLAAAARDPAVKAAINQAAQEGRIPVPALSAQLSITPSTTIDAFVQLGFRASALPGCGTFYSANDFVTSGCDKGLLGAASDPASITAGSVRSCSHRQCGSRMHRAASDRADP